jgi:hypothetical protein
MKSYRLAISRSCCLIGLLSLPVWADEPSGYAVTLFNGQNLDGWHVTGCEADVENGSLVLKSGNGLVRTDHRYGDFVLELDWKAQKPEKWDSGIYFRCELPPEGKPWPSRYQANLQQGREGNVGGLDGATSMGLVKPDDWNHFKLTLIGKTASLEINGKPAWKVDGVEATTGYIGLQSEVPGGGVFEFRNIRVTELGYKSLFNGHDLTRWEGGGDDAAKCWKVEDGMLVCTGEKGPWLRSKDQFDDFNLRLDYKLKPGGNSGVYCRVPLDGAHNARKDGPAGTEIQILDDADKRYADIKPYQFCGSVYAIAPARQQVGRAAGTWNTLEINCRGMSYRITHNGIVVVDATEDEFTELKTRQVRGFLGVQNHNEHVWFRNVRVGPAQP